MKTMERIAATALVVLLGATIYGLVRTGKPLASRASNPAAKNDASQTQVDLTSLLTAQQLVQMPTSEAELPFAKEALRLGDHEMDLAFAAAVRQAEEHPPALSAEAKEIQARAQKSATAVDADKARVEQLTAAQDKATGARKDVLGYQLQQAKAQAELDQDELDEAKQDLARAGGDLQGRIETLVQEHEASSKVADSLKVYATPPVNGRGLIHRYQQWAALHRKQLLLWQAKHNAESAASLFSQHHEELESRVKGQTAGSPGPPASSVSASNGNSTAAERDKSDALVSATKHRANDQKTLTNLDKQIDDQEQLVDVYSNWIQVVAAEQRIILNHALRGVLVILAIALLALFFESWIGKLLGKLSLDRRQVETLRTLTRVSLQVIAVLLILLVILGPPSQLGTVLGLAGAGLTVALKDFIVAFLGWLALMGKNGIRLGDWVEINGVTGEVVELGMFHTVLLETGNWTDSGHPTGRRVTFTNSFAIEGHYFNFSTSGQWLWDELQIMLPPGLDPYPVVDAIQKKVAEATAETSRQAELEWKGAAKSRGVSGLTAAPAINIKPVIGGIEIAVRYITRANERYQLRAKLYEAAVGLLGGKAVPAIPHQTPAQQEKA